MNRPATLLVLLLAGLLAGCGGGSRPTGIRTAETPADDVAEYQPRWRSHTVDSTQYRKVFLEAADLIVMNLLGDSRSPISLLEMGLYARSGKLFVACSPDYYRYDNVRITCRRYGVPLYDSLTARLDDLPQQSDE